MTEHSAKYYELKTKWIMGYITLATMRGWVALNEKKPGKGITAEEFQDITGMPYEA